MISQSITSIIFLFNFLRLELVAGAAVPEPEITLAPRQNGAFESTYTGEWLTTTEPVFPTGEVTAGSQTIESTFPLACINGFWGSPSAYLYCFLGNNFPNGTAPTQEFCVEELCQQESYDRMLDSLNCLVANGEERPYGYATNTSITAAPTRPAEGSVADSLPFNPLGLLDAEQANGWLSNITQFCSENNVNLDGDTSVTATPTTTGPYYTSYTSGQTIDLPTWTGLTQYPEPSFVRTVPAEYVSPPSSSGSGSDSGSASGASSAATSSSSGNAALPVRSSGKGGFSAILAGLLAYAVL